MNPAVSACISLPALRRNLRAIRARVPTGTALCPAVKADGYGHGIKLLLPVFQQEGAEALCVAHLEEGLQLRELGWQRPILCLGAPTIGLDEADSRERAQEAVAHGIDCTICTPLEIDLLALAAAAINRSARVQIKVDTGMGRMGVLAAEAVDMVLHASRQPGISISGVYTHLATADEADLAFARLQLAAMSQLIAALASTPCHVTCFHAANSAAIFRLPDSALHMVRPGLAVYGYWAGPVDQRPGSLEPVLRLESRISAVRRMPQGASIGYGRTYRTPRESVIGVVPIGYADGYRRELSNTGIVTIESCRGAPRSRVSVVGRVSMDQISIDLTDVPDVSPGDRVTIIDNAPDAPNSVEAIARQIGTIPYEVTCGLGARIRRVPVGAGDDS